MSGAAVLLSGVDRAAFAVAFADRLRGAGLDVGWARVETFTAALVAVRPTDRGRLYWTARTTLLGRPGDLATFDAVFQAVFGDAVLGVDPHARRTGTDAPPPPAPDDALARVPGGRDDPDGGGGLPWATLPPAVGVGDHADAGLRVPERLPSDALQLADTPFEQLDPADLELLRRRLAAAQAVWPTRRSRRPRIHPTGSTVLLRPTLARARRTGWEPVVLARSRPRRVPRRVVLVCDVSRSMQPYVVAHLHLLRAASVHADAEVFVFATTLRRLTPALRHRSADAAVARASVEVTDRFGGTRIAANLRTLLRSRHGNLLRGAVVVVLSDGWDTDPPEQLAAVMARVRRRAHRVVWVNPRSAAAGWEPLVGSMSAALPFCDRVLPGHTVRALLDVVDAVAGARSRRGFSSRA